MTGYDKILLARDPNRLNGKQLIDNLLDNVIELHGDRLYSDDPAIYGGIGMLNDNPVTFIAHNKGSDLEEKTKNNFGMAHPEGYRKAIRLMKQAEKFQRPIILVIDTAGAYPGIGAEERGQGSAIANCLFEFSDVKVPVISVLLSEGGSGGALALGVCDHMMIFENAFYSVISPEGYASILYKDGSRAADAVDKMKIMPSDLLEMKIVDNILSEPKSGLTDETFKVNTKELNEMLDQTIKENQKLSTAKLLEKRYNKFRKYGK